MKVHSELKNQLHVPATIIEEELDVFILNVEIEREEYVLENQLSRPARGEELETAELANRGICCTNAGFTGVNER